MPKTQAALKSAAILLFIEVGLGDLSLLVIRYNVKCFIAVLAMMSAAVQHHPHQQVWASHWGMRVPNLYMDMDY